MARKKKGSGGIIGGVIRKSTSTLIGNGKGKKKKGKRGKW
jgi:hypothetical protein